MPVYQSPSLAELGEVSKGSAGGFKYLRLTGRSKNTQAARNAARFREEARAGGVPIKHGRYADKAVVAGDRAKEAVASADTAFGGATKRVGEHVANGVRIATAPVNETLLNADKVVNSANKTVQSVNQTVKDTGAVVDNTSKYARNIGLGLTGTAAGGAGLALLGAKAKQHHNENKKPKPTSPVAKAEKPEYRGSHAPSPFTDVEVRRHSTARRVLRPVAGYYGGRLAGKLIGPSVKAITRGKIKPRKVKRLGGIVGASTGLTYSMVSGDVQAKRTTTGKKPVARIAWPIPLYVGNPKE